jgi:hypothetical protein
MPSLSFDKHVGSALTTSQAKECGERSKDVGSDIEALATVFKHQTLLISEGRFYMGKEIMLHAILQSTCRMQRYRGIHILHPHTSRWEVVSTSTFRNGLARAILQERQGHPYWPKACWSHCMRLSFAVTHPAWGVHVQMHFHSGQARSTFLTCKRWLLN